MVMVIVCHAKSCAAEPAGKTKTQSTRKESMKIPTKLVIGIATTLLALHAAPVFAWGAVASYDGRIVFSATDGNTPDEAKTAALEGCRDMVGKNCDWVSDQFNVTAIVASKPIRGNGIYVAADPDPEKAAKKAIKQCRINTNGDCGIIHAVWDGGPLWWARAVGESFNYIYLEAATAEDAKEQALKGCENGVEKKGSCQIDDFGNGPGWVATATKGDEFWRGYGATKAEATKDALKNCGDSSCKITWTGENRGQVPVPANMKNVMEMQRQTIAKWKKMGTWID